MTPIPYYLGFTVAGNGEFAAALSRQPKKMSSIILRCISRRLSDTDPLTRETGNHILGRTGNQAC